MTKSTKDDRLSPSSCRSCDKLASSDSERQPKTVLVFGVFDLLHPGHEYFLRQAKAQGDLLIVVVTRDERAEREKGRRPVDNLLTRLTKVQELPCVDQALPGDPVGEWGMVGCIQPTIICVGHDQHTDHPNFLAQLERLDPQPHIVQLTPFQRERYSTSRIRAELFDKNVATE